MDSRPEPEVVLVTEEGFALLTAELQNLEKVIRPQVTDDLRSFWTTTYHQVRKDLRGRYPKHAWPEDPLSS